MYYIHYDSHFILLFFFLEGRRFGISEREESQLFSLSLSLSFSLFLCLFAVHSVNWLIRVHINIFASRLICIVSQVIVGLSMRWVLSVYSFMLSCLCTKVREQHNFPRFTAHAAQWMHQTFDTLKPFKFLAVLNLMHDFADIHTWCFCCYYRWIKLVLTATKIRQVRVTRMSRRRSKNQMGQRKWRL